MVATDLTFHNSLIFPAFFLTEVNSLTKQNIEVDEVPLSERTGAPQVFKTQLELYLRANLKRTP